MFVLQKSMICLHDPLRDFLSVVKQKKRAQVFLLYVPNDIYPDFFPLSKSRDKLLFGKKVV